ncbi:putative membrane protein YfcA [Clostridium beijerinckii]|nr:putative membrane protein YfcA [Clostridium beijerinckii]
MASNVAALIAYILNGKVLFMIGIPAAICASLGNYLGAHFAIKSGAKIIKPNNISNNYVIWQSDRCYFIYK